MNFPTLFFFQDYVFYWRFYMNFRIDFSISTKTPLGVTLNPCIALDSIAILTISVPVHEHRLSFHLCFFKFLWVIFFVVLTVQVFHFLGKVNSYIFYSWCYCKTSCFLNFLFIFSSYRKKFSVLTVSWYFAELIY